MQLCLQETQRRHIKDVALCCEDVNELGQYGCKNYQNFTQKSLYQKIFSKENYKTKESKNQEHENWKICKQTSKRSEHFRHEHLSQENFYPENRYHKRNKHPTACQCWNCGEIWHKSINCTKRKANIVKLFIEEFDEIQHELYLITFEHSNILSNCYESISSSEDSILDTSNSSSPSAPDYWSTRLLTFPFSSEYT